MLKTINLSNNKIGDEGMNYLSNMFKGGGPIK